MAHVLPPNQSRLTVEPATRSRATVPQSACFPHRQPGGTSRQRPAATKGHGIIGPLLRDMAAREDENGGGGGGGEGELLTCM